MSQSFHAVASVTDAYEQEVAENRNPEFPVHPLILNRWSPRAYTNKPVTDEALFTILEAARWAPSSSNEQPWRFYVARSEEEHETFRTFIKPNNRLWTDHAPVLVLLASAKERANGDPNGAHAFDTGAAWGILALQARLLGLSTRAVGGYDRIKARETLQVPDNIELHAIIALGYRGEAEQLDAALQEREKPNSRRPLAESLIAIPATKPSIEE
ncbi:nitroreductase [Paenibacillus phyllosphaerae]|uniref:Nitroreductase n=1 Tax=Paenibacillus phyllosphaerae TaxID=274593 RepID=A0A7W5AWI0_9BACL|nr:nitroreductase family protein [Paenibacillus phyllosphaerae]MBB3110085.1 nitroreductase [Paenibacillus phyllosphaerae]